MKIESRYLDGSYLQSNPDWDCGDAAWKANQVANIVNSHKIATRTICEIGCGSGDVLRCLSADFPAASFFGYDVSPQAAEFWRNPPDDVGEFVLGEFHHINSRKYDLILMLDVFEHVRDPYSFLEASKQYAEHFVFHIPLDLSASAVARGKPLLFSRRKVGHLHFYTKDLALETLQDCGFKIIDWRYTGAFLSSPHRSMKTRLSSLPRSLACFINKDWGVRLLGGETLIVLAK